MGKDDTRVSKKLERGKRFGKNMKPGCGRKRKRDDDNFENLILTKTEDFESESRFETLPMDLLVKTLCHLYHDQLNAVFHVSQRLREAVSQARQFHFNYTTPDRSRQQQILSKGDGKVLSPHTPKAPTRAPRPQSRLNDSDMQQLAAVLFQESAFPPRCMVGLNEMH